MSENNINGGAQPGAISVYQGGDALDNFPVLKAFQQYVDAEQAKAHKRLMSVCVFFTVLLAAVVCGFIFVIAGMERRGAGGGDATVQALTALVAKMAGAGEAKPPAAPSAQDAELEKRNMLLQAKIEQMELEKRLREEFAAKLAEVTPPEPTPDEKTLQREGRRQKALEAKLRDREAKIASDEKRLRQKEIELQRRNLYPEYYVQNEPAAPAVPETVRPVSPEAAPQRAAAPAAKPPQQAAAPQASPDDDLDLSIFDEVAPDGAAKSGGAGKIDVSPKKENAGAWSVPLE